jgi:hypothetical protein
MILTKVYDATYTISMSRRVLSQQSPVLILKEVAQVSEKLFGTSVLGGRGKKKTKGSRN